MGGLPRQVAGRPGVGPAVRPRAGVTADRSTVHVGLIRRWERVVSVEVGAQPTPVRRPGSRGRAFRARPRRVRLPLAVGDQFLWFYLYPMLASLYYSFTKYDGILATPRMGRFLQLSVHVRSRPFVLAVAPADTIWIVVVGTPLQIVFAMFGIAVVLTKPKRRSGASYLKTMLLPADDGSGRRRGAVVPLPAEPAGPIDAVLRFLHLPTPLWFPGSTLVEAGSCPSGESGRRPADDHLPRRASQRPPPALRGRGDRRRQWPSEVPVRHPSHDLAGDLLLTRDR